MQFTIFTLRRLLRHWFLSLLMLMALSIAGAFLASLPSYAVGVASNSLTHVLGNASAAAKHIQINALPENLTAALYSDFKGEIGDLIEERLDEFSSEVSGAAFDYTQIENPGELNPESLFQIRRLHLWASTTYQSHYKIIAGEAPTYRPPQTQTEMLRPPRLEAMIGQRTAEQTGLDIGDVIYGPDTESYTIVGIIARLDPGSDVWWDNAIDPFEIKVEPLNENEDIITVPLILDHSAIRKLYPYVLTWRIFLNEDQITIYNIENILTQFNRLENDAKRHGVSFSCGLPNILENYRAQLRLSQRSLLLLSSQAFIFVLYLLSMLTGFFLEQAKNELATMVSRGATRSQISTMCALQGLFLTLPAGFLISPWLVQQSIALWNRSSTIHIPTELSNQARALALIAALLGWLALTLPVLPAARTDTLSWQSHTARPERHSWWQKKYLDLFLLLIGGLTYWQLAQTGSFIARRLESSGGTDPFLLIGPTLLLVAVALLFLRIFPYILHLGARLFQQGRGLILSIGFGRLARAPVGPSKVVLLISIAAALTFFAQIFQDTLTVRQNEAARYLIGADLTLALADAPFESLLDVPGVLAEARVFRSKLNIDGPSSQITLMAVESETFHQVSSYLTGISPIPLEAITNSLQKDSRERLPTIYSNKALPRGAKAGDRFEITLYGAPILIDVRGHIIDFPTLPKQFILADYLKLQDYANLYTDELKSKHQLWLRIDPNYYNQIIARPEIQAHLIGDAQAQLNAMRIDPFSQGASWAFMLNAAILLVLSIAGFWLTNYFSAQQRSYEFGILRAMGMSASQLFGVLTIESILETILGLLAGAGIGYSLAHTMRPFLAKALDFALSGMSTYQVWLDYPRISQPQPVSIRGSALNQLFVDWAGLQEIALLLAACFAFATLITLIALLRSGIHRALRIGDE